MDVCLIRPPRNGSRCDACPFRFAMHVRFAQDRPLPQSEREFRALFWQHIVRVDHRTAHGMPCRRQEVFVQVALRRARALSLYASCGDLDNEAIAALFGDSLIISSPQSANIVAPSHDVLEDWAILQWIEEQYATHEGSIQKLSHELGTEPAVRRTYRKWVSELLERDSAAADGLFQAVVHQGGFTAQFRDDTLVSILRSPASAAFLDRHETELLANDKLLLRRVIYLIRVACVITPDWLQTATAQASLFNVPDGAVWAAVLRLIQRNLDSFTNGAASSSVGAD